MSDYLTAPLVGDAFGLPEKDRTREVARLLSRSGQERRRWLDKKGQAAEDTLGYILGPAADPVMALGHALEFTDAGDMPAAADASRDLWNDPSLGAALDFAGTTAALAMPFYSAKIGKGVQSLADEMVDAYDPARVNALPIRSPVMAKVREKVMSPKVAARYGREHGLDITQNDVRQMRDLIFERLNNRADDPLIKASRTRHLRKPSAVSARMAKIEAEAAESARKRAAEAAMESAEMAAREATRSNLAMAARVSRSSDLPVRASRDKSGRISSYYVKTPQGEVRISDHELPWSPRRDFMAREHGQAGFSGFHGPELIVGPDTTPEEVAAFLYGAGRG